MQPIGAPFPHFPAPPGSAPPSSPDPFESSRELLDFTLLALLAEGPLHARSLAEFAPRVTAPEMRPAGDVIRRRIRHLFESGCVFIESRDDGPDTAVIHLSPQGRERFTGLMTARRAGPHRRADDKLLTLKTCVLDLVDPSLRPRVVDALINDRRAQLAHVQDSVKTAWPSHRFVQRCLSHEVAELEREIRWLESLRDAQPERKTAPRLTRAS